LSNVALPRHRPDTKDVHDGQPIDDMYGVTAQAFRTIAEGFGKYSPTFR